MKDSRLEKFADILVNYSTKVQKNDMVLIDVLEPVAIPLVEEVYKKVLFAGGHPYVHFDMSIFKYLLLKYGKESQISKFPEFTDHMVKNSQVYIGIGGKTKANLMANIDCQKSTLRETTIFPIVEYRVQNCRWVICRYPTKVLAEKAGMNLKEYKDFVFNAVLQDWAEMDKEFEKIKKIFDNQKEIRIVGKDTDLTFSLENRFGRKCCGKNNMPDGELCYAPVEDSIDGIITFEWPMEFRGGKEIEGIVLSFKDGKAVEAKAEKNEDLLLATLDADDGSRYIGEFGIGLNYSITQHTKNGIFDEKIGGTVHFALGSPLKDTGGKNKSNIHQDIIKDLRENGKIYVNGELVFRNGAYLK